ncbi:hypothetical protein BH20ACT5_BH20ACT5_07320 [soil metagenome]
MIKWSPVLASGGSVNAASGSSPRGCPTPFLSRRIHSVMTPQCSAKGCREPAAWILLWNNPRLHTPGREKQWTACGEHREHLAGFLSTRGFLRRVDPAPDQTLS